MKKFVSVLLSILSVIVLAIGVAGCNSGTNELQSKIDDLQSQLAEMNDKLSEMEEIKSELAEMNDRLTELENENKELNAKIDELEKELAAQSAGTFCLLEVAYENGWLNEDDLKSIACCYNDFQSAENPYSGMYKAPAEKLSNNVEKELKKAYLNQIYKYADDLLESVQILEDVIINYYYGTYNGNIAVKIYLKTGCIDPIVKDEVYIGNVVFKNYWDAQTWVYHIG